MRILVTGFTANYGGIENFLMNYYREMKKIDNSIVFDVITTSEQPAFRDELIEMGSKIHVVSRAREKKKVKNQISTIISENKYDVFWCNKCDLSDITYLEEISKSKISIKILHSHSSSNMHFGIRKIYVQIMHELNKNKISKLATNFWACSDYAARWLFPCEIASNKVEFIPNAINIEKFKYNEKIRSKYREKFNLQDKLVIGNVGAFLYAKNPEFALEIFKEIHNIEPKSILLWAGTGKLKDSIEEKSKSYCLEKSIKFLGRRNDIAELMQAMDCLILPSTFEGLPVVAIEAQATGLTVFAAKDGITKQTKITENLNFLRLSQTPKQWAEEILKTDLEHKDTTEQIIKSGFEIKTATQKLLKKIYINYPEKIKNI